MRRGLELFETRVRDLLVANCLDCHGGKKTESDLDLATREELIRGGANGPVIVLGSARASKLYKLAAHEEEPHMPDGADRLPDADLALLAEWIDCGGPYGEPLVKSARAPQGRPHVTDDDRQFWSFRPLSAVEPPGVSSSSWCQTPVDRFILARLEAAGIAPSPSLPRRALIRRVALDLTGLPPTPEEVAQFVDDSRPDAWPRLVDRLLANPRLGERWGRHWLDLARFAESHGYEQDYDRPGAWPYRDFVIRALNQDLPYDEFVRLQVAGDESNPGDPWSMAATGYLGAGTHATQITANQVEKERYDELDDMASTIGTSLLGLSIGCARCHDHKFDPIPSHDYYRFIATFTTTVRSELDVDFDPRRTERVLAAWEAEHRPLVDALAAFERDELPSRLAAWLARGEAISEPRWLVLEHESLLSTGGATFTRQPDGSYLAGGTRADKDTYVFTALTPISGLTALRIEALADPSLPKGGPGRADNGNFALTHVELSAVPAAPAPPADDSNPESTDPPPEPLVASLVEPKATFEQPGLPVAATIDGDPSSAWAVDPEFGKNHAAVYDLQSPFDPAGDTKLTLTLKFENNTGHSIGRLRVSISTAPPPAALGGDEAPANRITLAKRALGQQADARSDADRAALLDWFRSIDADWLRMRQQIDEHERARPAPDLTKLMVTSEGLPAIRLHTQGADFFESTYFLKRGDPSQKQGEAAPGFLQVLSVAPDAGSRWTETPPEGSRTSYRRRSLVNWLTDTDAGAGRLLARVIVNRLWQHHFGRGLVATPSDFGAQGARPTHPELLDYLAGELIRSEWRLKPVHRLILESAAYQQGGAFDEARAAADPDNRLWWRVPPRRLEGETIRDAILEVGGTRDPRMFGPGSLDENQPRRSIYFMVKRSQLIPVMTVFDAPEPLVSQGSRSSTTVAPQALALMNHAPFRRAARGLALRLAEKPIEDAVSEAYGLCLSRPPTGDELSAAVDFIRRQESAYAAGSALDARERAVSDFTHVLFCLNEFLYLP
jgi:hypothetical protein